MLNVGCFRRGLNGRSAAGFTMIEIALCLAIIGFALVAIIAALPIGMNTQRDIRQETIIGQDASVLLNDIRSGARGADDLTNYVYAVVNSRDTAANSFIYFNQSLAGQMNFSTANYPGYPAPLNFLTNGANIVGLLSTPEFENGISNHIVAYVRSISGQAAEKPPQTNSIMVGDAFSYRVYVVNAPLALPDNGRFSQALAASQHELRLSFLWPQRPNGSPGGGRQTFRATVGGQLAPDPAYFNLFFYQPQSFTSAP